MANLSMLDIKQAIWDERFRNLFPEYEKEFKEFLTNPNCSCNLDLYKKIFKSKDKLKTYFPTKTIVENDSKKWKVINCSVDELEKELKKLPPGQKQISIARWENQVTVVVNEVGVVV